MADIKPVSFRLSEEIVEKFKQLSVEAHCNQAEMFEALISSFELANAIGQIPDRAKEIQTFQITANTLVNMFVNSLAINQTAENTIREKLSVEMNSKDTTIRDLQQQKEDLEKEISIVKEKLEIFEEQNKEIKKAHEISNTELTQKTNTINSQLEQISTLNSILAEYKVYKDTNIQIEGENKDLLLKNSNLHHTNVDLEGKMINSKEIIEFFKTEINGLKNDKIEASKQLTQFEVESKSQRESLENKTNTEINQIRIDYKAERDKAETKFNIEIKKIQDELESKIRFEKQKIELEKGKIELESEKIKLINETLTTKNQDLKEQYNNIKLKLDEKLKSKPDVNLKP